MYQSVDTYINNNINKEISIEDFISRNTITNFDDVDGEMIKTFIEPEELMIKNVKFFNNFFIVDDKFLQLFFGDKNNININKIVNKQTFIGKEGIFIVDSKTMDNQNEPKTYIYFIKSMNKISLDEFRINKIYIFNKTPEFYNEFNNYMKGKSAESYFASRNFLNKGGIFNIMDNAKKIGLYIHIDRIEKYQDEEDSDENRPYLNKFLNFNY
jgi:hypothetical protein